jgi:hypothetical protein
VSWWVSVRMCDLGVCSCVATLCLASRATVVWGEKPNRAGKECGAPSGSVLDPSVEVSCEESATALVQLGAGDDWHDFRTWVERSTAGGGRGVSPPRWKFTSVTGTRVDSRGWTRVSPSGLMYPALMLWDLIHDIKGPAARGGHDCEPADIAVLGGTHGSDKEGCVACVPQLAHGGDIESPTGDGYLMLAEASLSLFESQVHQFNLRVLIERKMQEIWPEKVALAMATLTRRSLSVIKLLSAARDAGGTSRSGQVAAERSPLHGGSLRRAAASGADDDTTSTVAAESSPREERHRALVAAIRWAAAMKADIARANHAALKQAVERVHEEYRCIVLKSCHGESGRCMSEHLPAAVERVEKDLLVPESLVQMRWFESTRASHHSAPFQVLALKDGALSTADDTKRRLFLALYHGWHTARALVSSCSVVRRRLCQSFRSLPRSTLCPIVCGWWRKTGIWLSRESGQSVGNGRSLSQSPSYP